MAGGLHCTQCVLPARIDDLRWRCPDACQRKCTDGHPTPPDVSLDAMTGGIRCPACRRRYLTEAVLPVCGHVQALPPDGAGARYRHAVFVDILAGNRQWRVADRQAMVLHARELLKRQFVPGDFGSWVLWRRALPPQGWMELPPLPPLRLTRTGAAGGRRDYFLHHWRGGDLVSDPGLPVRLAAADLVILLVPAAGLVRSGPADAITGCLLGLAAAMEAGGLRGNALLLCLTGAERLLSLLGPSAGSLVDALGDPVARAAWLDRCAGFGGLAPLTRRFAHRNGGLVAGGGHAGLTDLGAWIDWSTGRREPS